MPFRKTINLTHERLLKVQYAPVLTLAMGLMLVRLLVLARLLEVSAFATYSAGLLVSSSFCLFACLGLLTLLQRELPIMIIRRRELVGRVLLMQCLLAAFLCTILAAVFAITSDLTLVHLSPAMLALAIAHGFSQQCFLVATVDSKSRGYSMKFSRENLTRATIISLAGCIAAALGEKAIFILIIEATLTLLISSRLLLSQFQTVPLRISTIFLIAAHRLPTLPWSSALILLTLTSLSFILINTDRWIAASLLTPLKFSQYAFAWIILMTSQSVQAVINASLFPKLAQSFASLGDRPAFSICQKTSLGLLALGSSLILPLWGILHYIISHWLTAYEESSRLLPIFFIIAILRASDFWSSYLIIIGKEKILLASNISCLSSSATIWWLMYAPKNNEISISQVAILALILTVTCYLAAALIAYLHARQTRRKKL